MAEVTGEASEKDEVAVVSVDIDWTEPEEKAAKRKLDCTVMPLLALGSFCFQLDRGNIANAITDNFMADVGITQLQFNTGNQLMYLGVILFEIPFNMALYRLGPHRWLTSQLFLFGMVATFQAFQTDRAAYLATRFLLGVAESGYFPGALWTLSMWYTGPETAKRVMCLYLGSQLGLAVNKLLAYGILQMRGVAGRPGWFWLFILMGLFTLMSAVVLGLRLPAAYHDPHSWFLPNARVFTDREIHILHTRVRLDAPNKAHVKRHVGKAAFKRAFLNWRLWIHVLINFCLIGPAKGLDIYSPSIISSFGFPALASNALASVGLFLQMPVSFLFSYASDRYGFRGESLMLGITLNIIGHVFNRIFTGDSHRGVRYFGVVWTQVFYLSHPLNVAWMSLTCVDPEQRSLAMAMAIMSANFSAMYGSQLYQADDKPLYRRAFNVSIGILACALVLSAVRYWSAMFRRRSRDVASASS